jgi:hypothetical protein
MNITVVYRIEREGNLVKLVRQGDLEILPPGFDPAQDTLSAQQTALRGIISRRLGEVFEAEIVAQGLEHPGQWAKLGKLPAAVMTTASGWLTAAWDLPSEDRVASLAGESAP